MTDNLYPKLLAPAQLGDILLENRVVMAPMTRSRSGEGDVATDLIAEYYGQRASAGLIISEASQISPQGKGYGALRAQFGGTYIANGGFSAQSAEQAIVSGEADFVAFGTPFIANPDLVARFRTNAELASFDPAFFYQGEEKGFTDYPPLASF